MVLRLGLRAAFLILFGWLVDRFWHTGWLLGICILSVIDREVVSIIDAVKAKRL